MSESIDLTEKECQLAVTSGKVIWVQANPNDMSIILFTNTSDKGFVIKKKGGAVKRYKSNFDRELVITKIKGG